MIDITCSGGGCRLPWQCTPPWPDWDFCAWSLLNLRRNLYKWPMSLKHACASALHAIYHVLSPLRRPPLFVVVGFSRVNIFVPLVFPLLLSHSPSDSNSNQCWRPVAIVVGCLNWSCSSISREVLHFTPVCVIDFLLKHNSPVRSES